MIDEELEFRIDLIEKELERIKILYEKTISYKKSDPEVSLSQARKSAEAICKQIYLQEGLEKNGKPVNKLMLDEFIQVLNNKKIFPQYITINLRTIQAFGNFSTHDQGEENQFITEENITPCLQALANVVHWYFCNYHNKKIILSPEYDTTALNRNLICHKCGEPVQQDWKYCPCCETQIKTTCSKCNYEISKKWNTCPKCNTKIVSYSFSSQSTKDNHIVNLTGKWHLTEEYDDGETTAEVYLTQQGSKLYGRMRITDKPDDEDVFVIEETIVGFINEKKYHYQAQMLSLSKVS